LINHTFAWNQNSTNLKFSDFKLHESVHEGIEAMGFDNPTPIQKESIPQIVNNRDIIACAQTGSGKTAAFLLPVISKVESSNLGGKTQVIIIAPTRELAIQIDKQAEGFTYFTSVSSASIYGGVDAKGFENETKLLKKGTEIIVATPGKLITHINMGHIDFNHIHTLVLDEADRMLDMGFYEDIMQVMKHLKPEVQKLMFSATMPPKIRTLAKKILNNPYEVSLSVTKPAENITQAIYEVSEKNKVKQIAELLKGKDLERVIIFCSTKKNVDILSQKLKQEGLNARHIHSDLDQKEREEALIDFRNKKYVILVATDIMSRGIDIEGIEIVVNYNVPHDAEDYVHRIGRTARAEKSGLAITLVSPEEANYMNKIEKQLGIKIYRAKA
jgi:ATP-dependent RNA helicase RhlE